MSRLGKKSSFFYFNKKHFIKIKKNNLRNKNKFLIKSKSCSFHSVVRKKIKGINNIFKTKSNSKKKKNKRYKNYRNFPKI